MKEIARCKATITIEYEIDVEYPNSWNMNEIEEAYGNLVCACNDEIDLLHQLYNTRGYHHDTLRRLNLLRANFREYENKMVNKYDEFAPRPVCDKE